MCRNAAFATPFVPANGANCPAQRSAMVYVLDEDNRGPVRLWAIERLVDDLVSRAAWDPDKPGAGKK